MSADLFPEMEEASRPTTEEGCVLIARAISRSSTWTLPPAQFKVALLCILKANWKAAKVYVDGREVLVRRGQFISSLVKIATETKVTRKVAIEAISKLSEKGVDGVPFLSMRRCDQGTIFTITKYDHYQNLKSYQHVTNAGGQRRVQGGGQGRVQGGGHKHIGDVGEEGKTNGRGRQLAAIYSSKTRGPTKFPDAISDFDAALIRIPPIPFDVLMEAIVSDQMRGRRSWEIVRFIEDGGMKDYVAKKSSARARKTKHPVPPPGRLDELDRKLKEAKETGRYPEAARIARVMRGEQGDE